MFNVKVKRRLDASEHEVWEVLKDFGGHYRFDPYIQFSPICNDISEGLGAEREVTIFDGPVVRQKIIDYEEGRMILIGITDSSWPIKRGWVRIELEPISDDSCLLSYHLHFVPPFGLLAPIIGLYYKPVFQGQYNVILRSVEHFVRTGEKYGDI